MTLESSLQKLNWARLTVMIVDDDRFVRTLMESALRAFGIGEVVAESDGATAIKRLKLSKVDPHKAGIHEIDLILSDYRMPSVDGNLFLHWIRTGDQVPDRFVPFIMISGAADREVVEEARDAGVTEFLAKPFSANSLAERFLQVVNKPRPFILARGFFGPDRRRTVHPFKEERRSADESDIQVVRSETHDKTLRDDVRAIHFHLPNKLRDKLGPHATKGDVGLDPAIIKAAEARIKEVVGDYTDWVSDYIDKLSAAQAALVPIKDEKADENAAANRRKMAEINRIAHELRGQGGLFDYPLITSFGKSLYKVTLDPTAPITRARLKLISAHVNAIRTVFQQKASGDGGSAGSTLLREITEAVKLYNTE